MNKLLSIYNYLKWQFPRGHVHGVDFDGMTSVEVKQLWVPHPKENCRIIKRIRYKRDIISVRDHIVLNKGDFCTWLVEKINVRSGLPFLSACTIDFVGIFKHNIQVAGLQAWMWRQLQSLDPIFSSIFDRIHIRRVLFPAKIFRIYSMLLQSADSTEMSSAAEMLKPVLKYKGEILTHCPVKHKR